MTPKIIPTMNNPISLQNMCNYWPLYTLPNASLKINFLYFFLLAFLYKPSFHPCPKKNQIRPPIQHPWEFWKKSIYIFRMELYVTQYTALQKLTGLKSTRSSFNQFIDRSKPSATKEKSQTARNSNDDDRLKFPYKAIWLFLLSKRNDV